MTTTEKGSIGDLRVWLGDSQTNGSMKAKVGRCATITVAASDASTNNKAQSDYVCSGTNDNLILQTALDTLPVGGGELRLSEGTFNLSNSISRTIDNVTISGSGYNTYVVRDSINYVIEVGARARWVIKNLRVDYGGIEISNAIKWVISNVWRDTQYQEPLYIDNWSAEHLGTSDDVNLFALISNHPAMNLISDFETDNEWTHTVAGYEGTSVTYDTTIKHSGTRSIKIVTAVNAQVFLEKAANFADYTNGSFSIWLYTEDYTKLSSIELDIRTTLGGWTHYGKLDCYSVQTVNSHWYKMVFPYLPIAAGTPDYTQTNLIRFRIKPVAGQSATVWLDEFKFWKRTLLPKGAVSFTFDDGLSAIYTKVKPMMDVYQFAGVWSFVIGRMDATSIEYARNAQECGWDIVSHSYDHDTVKTTGEPLLQYGLAQKWLADNGFKAGSRFALLHGGANSTSILNVVNNRLQISRCSLAGYGSLPDTGNLVYSYPVDAVTSVATIKGYIDIAVANRLWLNLMFHDVVDADATGVNALTASVQEIITYCNTAGIECLTYSQVVDRIKATSNGFSNSGTGTIVSGSTSTNVRHGFTSKPQRILISPNSSLGSASSIWISDDDTGTGNLFTVSVNTDPLQDVTFYWVATL